MALFALKSLTLVFYSGILFVASGLLFPLPLAIAVNIVGTAIMATIPYFVGKKSGQSYVDGMKEKHPKLRELEQLHIGNEFFFTVLLRSVNVLPLDPASMYFGAAGFKYLPYMLGTVVGMMTNIVTFPIIGGSAAEPGSKTFIISVSVDIAYALMGALGFYLCRRRAKRREAEADSGDSRE